MIPEFYEVVGLRYRFHRLARKPGHAIYKSVNRTNAYVTVYVGIAPHLVPYTVPCIGLCGWPVTINPTASASLFCGDCRPTIRRREPAATPTAVDPFSRGPQGALF